MNHNINIQQFLIYVCYKVCGLHSELRVKQTSAKLFVTFWLCEMCPIAGQQIKVHQQAASYTDSSYDAKSALQLPVIEACPPRFS
jgi:hypothetical protein